MWRKRLETWTLRTVSVGASETPFQLYLQAITGEAQAPLITADSAAYTNRVMTAIYDGAAEMNWVRLDH